MVKIFSVLLILATAITSIAQATQPVPPLSNKAAAVKHRADALSTQSPITVVRAHAPKNYGTFISNDETGFTFYDVDKNLEVKLNYGDVRKIEDGYGGHGSTSGRRMPTAKKVLITVGVALIIPAITVAILVSSKD